jgi:hypothetical protein
LGTILGYTYLGFYTQADITDPKVAKPASGTTAARGDLKYLDRNENGVDRMPMDRITLEYPNLPNTILGFTTGLNFQRIQPFTATIAKRSKFWLTRVSETANPFQNNFREIHLGAWTPDNSENPPFRGSPPFQAPAIAKLSIGLLFIRGDYLRLKTAEIGYDLPARWLKRIRFKNARIYANGYNCLPLRW